MSRKTLWNLSVVAGVAALATGVAFYRESRRPVDEHTPGLPRMIDLGANECRTCKEMAPYLAQLQREYAGRAVIQVVNVFQHPGTLDKYDARIMPTQIFFDAAGKEVWRNEGFLSKDAIKAKLAELGAR